MLSSNREHGAGNAARQRRKFGQTHLESRVLGDVGVTGLVEKQDIVC